MNVQSKLFAHGPTPLLFALAASVLLALTASGCSSHAAGPLAGPPPAQVSVATVMSREEYDARASASAQSEASVRGAEAAVATARLNLQFTQVRAPITGRAGRALITAGNLAQADATLLTTLVSLDPVHVYFEG